MSDEHAAVSDPKIVDFGKFREEFGGGGRGGGGGPPGGGAPSEPESSAVFASEDAMGLQLVDELGEDWHYVEKWDDWITWNGSYWERDQKCQVFDRARIVCRGTAGPIDTRAGALRRFISSRRVTWSVEQFARKDPRMIMTPEVFDGDPFLLNTPAGIVDLNTGQLYGHDRDKWMTELAGAGPEGECPTWMRFLHEITGGDVVYQQYLQRLIGYSLTGSCEEEIFAFCYGPPNTGKSKFVETIRLLHGTYGTSAPMSSFVATTAERHPTDLAGFVGKRLVTAAETDEGRRWDQQRITNLTGRDQIKARFMRGDFFSYYPQFLLIFHGNCRPRLGGVDMAMRRRLHLLPFTNKPKQIDAHLIDKFKLELGGIMVWAVHGAVLWRKHGLQPPPIVLQATKDYFDRESLIESWLDDRCARDPNAKTELSTLYADYAAWAKKANEYILPQRRFTDALENLGFNRDRDWRTRHVQVVGLAITDSNGELGL
jgi:putative DNA primase/helicase